VALPSGTRLGPYEILAPVASGGMGDVYKARDSRLDRTVAIKVLQAEFSARFEREARAIATLNHAHICQLYDVGPDFLVMEYVDGGPIQPTDDQDKLLQHALQIADGLAAAHAAGVVHRDLKPANILLTSAGDAKILDFGVALIRALPKDEHGRSAGAVTEVGTILGTPGYMSPEQARGEPADVRSDLWSLGAVLYELATGVPPFGGSSVEIYEAVLSRRPEPVRERNPKVAAELARIIERLLERDRSLRYQTAADVRADLQRVSRDRRAALVTVVGERAWHAAARVLPRNRVARVAVLSATAVLLAAAGGSIAYLRTRPPTVAPASAWVQLTDFADSVTDPALSPDGRMVAFIRGGQDFPRRGNAQIYVKQLPNGESVRLTETSSPKYGPAFSPDGSRVGYTSVERSGVATSWETWTASILGGVPTRFLGNAAGLVWIDDQHMLFSEIKGTGLHMGVVTAAENRADRREIYFPGHEREMAHYSYLSPNRRWLLIVEMGRTGTFSKPCLLMPFDGASGVRPVGPDGGCSAAAWSPDGRWMYFGVNVNGSNHLWRQRYPGGTPEQVTFGPTEEEGIAVAQDGSSLVTSVGQRRSKIWFHDAHGDRALTAEGEAWQPRLSDDGSRVYYLLRRGLAPTVNELRAVDVATGRAENLLPGLSPSDFDVSDDGREVAFTLATEGGDSRVWLAPLDRREPPREVARGGDRVMFGKHGELLFRGFEQTKNVLMRVNRDGTGLAQVADAPIIDTVDVSPDGTWATVMAPGGGEEGASRCVAIPLGGGEARSICAELGCSASWAPGGKFFVVRFEVRADRAYRVQAVMLPLLPGEVFPALPSAGLTSDNVAATVNDTGGTVIDRDQVFAASDPSTYGFLTFETQRNLFRIPLE
jgi:Tol biopolymer transport system component/predicted Ser/Thr protein kinase